jgi:adenylate kinase
VSVRLVILGRPGAGKGTQCVDLAAHYKVPHVSTGDMLRHAVAVGTDLGKQAKSYMDSGGLVPDDVIVGVVGEQMAEPGFAEGGWLLDGFPRTVPQAGELQQMTADAPIQAVVNLEVPAEVVQARIAGRRAEEGRTDDGEDAVRKRLQVYEQDTAPVVEWYRERGLLTDIDGIGTRQEVFDRLVRAIDERMA